MTRGLIALLLSCVCSIGANITNIYTGQVQTNGMQLTSVYAAWDPTSIPGLKLWIDANSFAGHANGTAETNWPDKSASANNGVYTTMNSGTAYYTNSGLNSKPAVKFNGNGGTTGAYYLFGAVTARPYTIFLVLMTPADISITLWLGSGSGAGQYSLYNDSTEAINVNDGTGANQTYPAYTLGLPLLVSVTHSNAPTNPLFHTNGVLSFPLLQHSENGTASLNNANTTVGGRATDGYCSNMLLSEVLVYDTLLSTANRQLVEAYLRAKWSLW
jgi:hypothetical protein